MFPKKSQRLRFLLEGAASSCKGMAPA
jgi:hypothetical protein